MAKSIPALAICVVACAPEVRTDPFGGPGPGPVEGGETGGLEETTAPMGTASEPSMSDGTGVKFDAGDGGVTAAGEGGTGEGCKKVDFVFIVDNSGSMSDEQAHLAASFPAFITAIQQTVVSEYRIMAVDTDAGGGGGCSQTIFGPNDCNEWCETQCSAGCDCSCNGAACPSLTSGCDEQLGAGKVLGGSGDPCGVVGGNRWLDETQPELSGTFQCVATVGTVGDGNERPMAALIAAITTENQTDQCNAGFLRDDALLVVTVITDEEDIDKSPGDPSDWHSAVVAAKGGDQAAIVALALVGDAGQPGSICQPYDENGDGAEDAPRLRQWADAFTHGSWGSVCEADYSDFFANAVAVIDTACDEFVPPG